MASIWIIALVISLSSLSQSSSVDIEAAQQSAANETFTKLNNEYHRLEAKRKVLTWDSLNTTRHELNQLKLEYKNLYTEGHEILRKYPPQNISSPVLQRILKVLNGLIMFKLTGTELENLENAINHIENVPLVQKVCSYQNRTKCNLSYLPKIRSAFAQSSDPDELKYYWTEWRNEIGPISKAALGDYLDVYKKTIAANNITNILEAYYYEYEDANFLAEITTAIEILQPLYKEFHAYVRHILRQKYGENIISKNGLIPQHLLDQVTLQAWKKDSLLEQPFPKKRLPNLRAELDGNEFSALKIVQVAADFFKSIGMMELPGSFWENHARVKSSKEAGPDCKADVLEYGVDAALRYCPKSYFKRFLQMHRDMTKIQYILYRNQQPIALRDEACPGFGSGMGEAVLLSASSPHYIQKIGLLSNATYDDEQGLNRLFRQGVNTILSLPSYYVHEKVWVGLLEGEIKLDEVNCVYWELMEQFGLEPPVSRNNSNFDLPYKFFEGVLENQHHTKKIFSEILGYQLYRSLCEKSGQFARGDAYRTLENCDFFGKPEAGSALREMMSYGAKKPWREVIKSLTGTEKLSAGGLMEFYEPLRGWLEEQNLKNNVQVGWTSSTKCQR